MSDCLFTRLDQPGQGENLGFIAQAVQTIFPELVSTTSPTSLTPDGTLTLNYVGLISPIVASIQDIAHITGDFQNNLIAWLGAAGNGIGDLFAKNLYATNVTAQTGNFQQVNANELCATDGPNDSNPVCITKAQLAAILSQSASADLANPTPASPTTSLANPTPETPPVIQINGQNPAMISVGTTYNDLGATITVPQPDLNLGITTYVNGAPMNPIQIDTTQAATDTIDYVVTDPTGLTSTSTRTVIIQSANDNQSSTTTAATSTAQ